MYNPSLNKKEKKFLLITAIGLLLFTCIPYLYGYLIQTKEWRFMGVTYNLLDQNVYFSFIKQVTQGRWLLTNKFSPEGYPSVIFNPFFLVLGWFSKLLPAILVYQGARIILALVFLLLLYKLLAVFLADEFQRKWTLIFIATSSGFGWFIFLANKLSSHYMGRQIIGISWNPIDFWWPEAYTFFSLYALPHFTISLILIVLVFLSYLKFITGKEKRHLVYSALLCLLLGLVHGYDVITIYAVLGIFTFASMLKTRDFFKPLKSYLLFIALSVASTLHNLYIVYYTPISSYANTLLLPPKIFVLLLGYGFLPIFAAYYLIKGQGEKPFVQDDKILFLLSWILGSLALVYLPLPLAPRRRFIMGLHIPLGILASLGIFELIKTKSLGAFRNKALLIAIIIVGSLSNPLLLARHINALRYSPRDADYHFIIKDKLLALKWLETNSNPEEIVLSHYNLGNYIPRLSGNTVFWGHWDLTAKKAEKGKQFKQFLQNYNTETAENFLRRYNISYIILPRKIALNTPMLKSVYENKSVRIYRVSHN